MDLTQGSVFVVLINLKLYKNCIWAQTWDVYLDRSQLGVVFITFLLFSYNSVFTLIIFVIKIKLI